MGKKTCTDCVAEEETFFLLCTSLTFRNKNEFALQVRRLKAHKDCLTSQQQINVLYTIHNLGYFSVTLTWLQLVFDKLPFEYQRDALLTLSYDVVTPKDVSMLCHLASDCLARSDDDQIRQLALLDTAHFKPLLFTGVRRANMINRDVLLTVTKGAMLKLKAIPDRLSCLEKLVHHQSLTEEDLIFLYDILSQRVEFTGRVIDILFSTQDPQHVRRAHEIVSSTTKGGDWHSSDNAVHYLNISDSVLGQVKCMTMAEFHTCVDEMTNMMKLVSYSTSERDNIYTALKHMLTSGYVYKSCKLEFIMTFAWLSCVNFDEKKLLMDEMAVMGDHVCIYGLIINIMAVLVGLGKGDDFLVLNNEDDGDARIILEKMRLVFEDTDDIWSDPVMVEKLTVTIKSLMESEPEDFWTKNDASTLRTRVMKV